MYARFLRGLEVGGYPTKVGRGRYEVTALYFESLAQKDSPVVDRLLKQQCDVFRYLAQRLARIWDRWFHGYLMDPQVQEELGKLVLLEVRSDIQRMARRTDMATGV